jgi:hypothetical protein
MRICGLAQDDGQPWIPDLFGKPDKTADDLQAELSVAIRNEIQPDILSACLSACR